MKPLVHIHAEMHAHTLTWMDPLPLYMSLQLSPQLLLASSFTQSSIIHQQEVRVHAIKTGALTEWIPQSLVVPQNLVCHKGRSIHRLAILLTY